MTNWRQSKWFILSGIIILIDQLTKYFVVQHVDLYQMIYVLPIFDLTHLQNTGAAFSFLNNHSGWQRWFLSGLAVVISIGLIVWLLRLAKKAYWQAIGLSFILGGAIGNLIDRIRLGHVTDFLFFHWGQHYWPAFNVADSAVCVGALCLAIGLMTTKG